MHLTKHIKGNRSMSKTKTAIVLAEDIQSRILIIRNRKVILDADLARLYEVTTTRLNEQVRRNLERFPEDFMFQLTKEEFSALISQNATSKVGHGGRRKLPLVFTEYGAVMAASVLNSPRAVDVSVYVVRAFISLRELAASYADLAKKIEELESKYDAQFAVVFDAIKQLMIPPDESRRRIGFRSGRHER